VKKEKINKIFKNLFRLFFYFFEMNIKFWFREVFEKNRKKLFFGFVIAGTISSLILVLLRKSNKNKCL
jgi:hypothetical protein